MRNWRLSDEGGAMSEMLKPAVDQAVLSITKGAQFARSSTVASGNDREKMCKSFESYFIFNMLQEMDKTTKFSEKGYAEQTYMSIVYEKVADFLAEKGIGIKDMLMRYTSKEDAKVLQKSGDNSGK